MTVAPRHIFSLLFLASFVAACENSQKDIDTWTKDKLLREEATGVESYMSQEGKMKARLIAPLMYRMVDSRLPNDSQYVEFPDSLHVDFYNDSLQIETWLDCLYAKYYEREERVYLRDSVVVITVKGDTLKSPDLWWDQRKGIFYTDKYAQYITKDNNIQGNKGLVATQDLKKVSFEMPTGIFDMKET
ncbi:MAG TPA: LPS export ABC transporter periplasmic protein LptC, partial [Chitinophagaceae bacterium]|nr:LPS export ABC transporter periplasmic protein LptC [Chitinophagaceae bacterium]